MTRAPIVVLAALLLTACGVADSPAPASADESIAVAARGLQLSGAHQVWKESANGQELAVFVGSSGVLDGVGLVVVDAAAPWAVSLRTSGSRSRADPASLLMAGTGDATGTVTYLYGTVSNPLITTLQVDLPTGTCDVAVRSPAFAVALHGANDQVPPGWRFLDISGRVVFEPTAPRPSPSTSASAAACG